MQILRKYILGPIEKLVINSTISKLSGGISRDNLKYHEIIQKYLSDVFDGFDPFAAYLDLQKAAMGHSGKTYSPMDTYRASFMYSWYWFPRRILRYLFKKS